MSDLAASGGYYVAMAAPTIVAQPGDADRLHRHLRRQVRAPAAPTRSWAPTSKSITIGRNAAWNRRIGRSTTASARSCASRSAASTKASSRRWQRRERCLSRASTSSRRAGSGRAHRPSSSGWSTRWAGSIARSRWRKTVRASRPIHESRSSLPAAANARRDADRGADRRGHDRQLEAMVSLVGGMRTAERRALGLLTAPARLFNPGEPLALMPVGFLR